MSTSSYFGIDTSNSKVKENTHNWSDCNQNQWGRPTHSFTPNDVISSTQDAKITRGTSRGNGVVGSHPSLQLTVTAQVKKQEVASPTIG